VIRANYAYHTAPKVANMPRVRPGEEAAHDLLTEHHNHMKKGLGSHFYSASAID